MQGEEFYHEVLAHQQHVCWDGWMFPNEVMAKPETWNSILETLVKVRDAHGWQA